MPLLDLYSLWTGAPFTPPVVVTVSQLQVLYQADILVDGIAGSTEFARIRLSLAQAMKEATQFGDPARWYKPAVYGVEAFGDFYYQAGNGGAFMVNELEARTIGPNSPGPMVLSLGADQTVGNLVNIWKGVNAKLEEGGIRGEVNKATLTTEGASRCVQAKRLLRAQQSGSSGTGQAVYLGPSTSDQGLYAALHMVGTTGPVGASLSIVSAATSTLAGPTTRVTFNSGTSGLYGEWEERLGAITDPWFAAQWTGFPGTAFTASISAGVD